MSICAHALLRLGRVRQPFAIAHEPSARGRMQSSGATVAVSVEHSHSERDSTGRFTWKRYVGLIIRPSARTVPWPHTGPSHGIPFIRATATPPSAFSFLRPPPAPAFRQYRPA